MNRTQRAIATALAATTVGYAAGAFAAADLFWMKGLFTTWTIGDRVFLLVEAGGIIGFLTFMAWTK